MKGRFGFPAVYLLPSGLSVVQSRYSLPVAVWKHPNANSASSAEKRQQQLLNSLTGLN